MGRKCLLLTGLGIYASMSVLVPSQEKTVKKNAASACQEKSGAAFAAFQANLKLLLERNSMSIVTTAGLSEEGVYQDLFLLWESALQTYFENLPRAGILLSSSTSALWLSKALSIEFDIAFLPGFCSGGLSEVGRPFLDYAQQFFPAFFAAAYAQPSEAGENLLPQILSGLSLSVLVALFIREAASFLPAATDHRVHPLGRWVLYS